MGVRQRGSGKRKRVDVMSMTCPLLSSSTPPELPGLMTASVQGQEDWGVRKLGKGRRRGAVKREKEAKEGWGLLM